MASRNSLKLTDPSWSTSRPHRAETYNGTRDTLAPPPRFNEYVPKPSGTSRPHSTMSETCRH
eukprot:544727-Amphidinium_carterae.1